MKHELKIEPAYFRSVLSGDKTFEIRRNDRGFKLGDIILLREHSSYDAFYTSRELIREICYITNFQQKEGWVVLGTKEVTA